VDLDQYGALVLAAGKSQLFAKKEEAQAVPKGTTASPILIQASSGGAGPASNDSLVPFFEPDRVSLEPITGTELRYPSDEILPEPHPSRVVLEPDGTRRIRFNDYRPNGGDTCLPPPADISVELVAVKKNVLRLWLRLLARISQRGRCIGALDLRKSCCENGLSRRQGNPDADRV
jgi:hypothetical protein